MATKFGDEIGHSSAPLKNNCVLYAPTPYFRPRAIRWCHLNFSSGDPCCHGNEIWNNGLDLGLYKRYMEDICVRWGVFVLSLFWYAQCVCAIIEKCIYAPLQKSYVKYTKNRYYLL